MLPNLRRAVYTALGLLVAGTAAAAPRPNILFLMADQLRGDCLGADGNRVISTPNLDRLAGTGARFRCAYSSVPPSPARGPSSPVCRPGT
jgi:hypothetical protein